MTVRGEDLTTVEEIVRLLIKNKRWSVHPAVVVELAAKVAEIIKPDVPADQQSIINGVASRMFQPK